MEKILHLTVIVFNCLPTTKMALKSRFPKVGCFSDYWPFLSLFPSINEEYIVITIQLWERRRKNWPLDTCET